MAGSGGVRASMFLIGALAEVQPRPAVKSQPLLESALRLRTRAVAPGVPSLGPKSQLSPSFPIRADAVPFLPSATRVIPCNWTARERRFGQEVATFTCLLAAYSASVVVLIV